MAERVRPPLLVAPSEPPGPLVETGAGGPGGVLRSVLRDGPVSRGGLARSTGLSAASVSRHTSELIALGLLRERRPPNGPPRSGRPQVPVDIEPAHHVACGVHIAVEHTTYALVDLRGRVTAQERRSHTGEPGRVLGGIRQHLPRFLERHASGRSVLGVGVATGGWVNGEAGTVVEHGPLGWRDVPVRAALASATRLPVHLDGHARALAHAELMFGAGAHSSELVQLFVGNVVDAAVASGGSVLRGSRWGAGGVAHLALGAPDEQCDCGRRGCLQPAVGELAVAHRAFATGVIPAPDYELLLTRARDGHRPALDLLRTRLRTVGRAAALLLDLAQPEVLVVADRSAEDLPGLRTDLYEGVAAHAHLCADPERAVVLSTFGHHVPAVAAGAVVLDAVYRRPLDLRTARSARSA